MLAAALAYRPGETPDSYASRLAYRCGCEAATDFCKDFGTTFRAVVTGTEGALGILAHLGGADPDDLSAAAFTKVGTEYRCAGQVMTKDTFDRTRLRVCPACLRDDLAANPGLSFAAAWRRVIWMITPIRTCPDHGLALVDLIPTAEYAAINYQDKHDFVRLLERAAPGLDCLIADAPRRQMSDFENYLLARLGGVEQPAVELLNRLPFHFSARACEVVGAVALEGIDVPIGRMAEEILVRAAPVGFDLLRGEGQAFRTMLRELAFRHRDARGNSPGVQVSFGNLFSWLKYGLGDDSQEPLREVLREVAFETIPFRPGDTVLGRPSKNRRVHSVWTAAVQLGVSRNRMRALLHAAGIITDADLTRTHDRIIFPADERAERFLDRVRTALPFEDAPAYLGVSKKQMRQFVAAGAIKPLDTGPYPSGKHTFATDTLDEFLARLSADAKLGSDQNPRVDIARAARLAACRTVDVVQLILDRKLAVAVRDMKNRGFRFLLVDLEEVIAALRRQRLSAAA